MNLEKLLFKNGLPQSESEKRKVMLGGYFFVISLFTNLFFFLVNLFNPKETYQLFYLSGGMAYSLLSLYLLRIGRHNLAIIAYLIFINILVFLFTYPDPKKFETGTYIFYVLISFGALSVFGFKEIWKGLLFTVLGFVLFLVSIFDPSRFNPGDAHFYLILNILIILLVGSMILLFYDRQVIRSEQLLQIKNEELKKTNAELDRFVYSASHDLRAPLSSIQGLIKVYQMSNNGEKDKMVELIQNRVHKLDDFIKDIIQYSRNARVELIPVTFNISELIQTCWENLRYSPLASTIQFINDCNPNLTVVQDPDRLRIILENLISNGIKYSKIRSEDSFIKISIRLFPDSISLEYQDNGVGIKEDKQRKVFDMFYRAHENSEGSGLGLFIVHEIIQKMNGQIRIHSVESQGTSFHIQLPLLELEKVSLPESVTSLQ